MRRLWPRFGGALLTVCAAAVVDLLSSTALRIPIPPREGIIIDMTERKLAELSVELHGVVAHEEGAP